MGLKWVGIDERKPEDGQMVEVLTHRKEGSRFCHYDADKDKFVYFCRSKREFKNVKGVTQWLDGIQHLTFDCPERFVTTGK